MSQRAIAKFLFTIKNTSFFFPSFRETTIKLPLNEINRLPLDPFSIPLPWSFGGRAKRCKNKHEINYLHKSLRPELVVVIILQPTSWIWYSDLTFLILQTERPNLSTKMADPPNLCTAHGQPNAGDCAAKTTFWWHMSGCVGWLAPCLEILFCIPILEFRSVHVSHRSHACQSMFSRVYTKRTWKTRTMKLERCNVRRHTLVRISSSIYPSLSHLKAADGCATNFSHNWFSHPGFSQAQLVFTETRPASLFPCAWNR